MPRRRGLLHFCFLPIFVGLSASAPAGATDLNVTGTYRIANDTTFDDVIVRSTGIPTVDAVLTVNANMAVQGRFLHSGYPVDTGAGLRLNGLRTPRVGPTGVISAGGLGLRGGKNGSSAGRVGKTWNAADAAVAPGGTGAAGESFGGIGGVGSWGGIANPGYSVLEDATQFCGSRVEQTTISAGTPNLDRTTPVDAQATVSGGTIQGFGAARKDRLNFAPPPNDAQVGQIPPDSAHGQHNVR